MIYLEIVITIPLLKAYDLADEFRNRVKLPSCCADTDKLVDSILGTNKCICPEVGRIWKGVQDLERIKDNFENQSHVDTGETEYTPLKFEQTSLF